MKAFIGNFLVKLPGNRAGFTLVEMLVVVAIIVALAAVIVPTVTVFLSKGEEGAQKAELESIQTAMDALMASNGILTVTVPLEPYTNDLTEIIVEIDGVGDSLSTYFKETTSIYCYAWTTEGLVTQKATDPAVC